MAMWPVRACVIVSAMRSHLLAAACAYHAMTQPRAYRAPLTAKQAADELRTEVQAGRLDAAAVDAVLTAAGQPPRKRRSGPAGLTPREIEVLTCLGRGMSNAQIASGLHLSEATVKSYVSRMLVKLDCENRLQAGLLAYDAGLVPR